MPITLPPVVRSFFQNVSKSAIALYAFIAGAATVTGEIREAIDGVSWCRVVAAVAVFVAAVALHGFYQIYKRLHRAGLDVPPDQPVTSPGVGFFVSAQQLDAALPTIDRILAAAVAIQQKHVSRAGGASVASAQAFRDDVQEWSEHSRDELIGHLQPIIGGQISTAVLSQDVLAVEIATILEAHVMLLSNLQRAIKAHLQRIAYGSTP